MPPENDKDTNPQDVVHPIDLEQLGHAVSTLKSASIHAVEKNYGVGGGAALSALFGATEYLADKFLPQIDTIRSGPPSNVTDVDVSASQKSNDPSNYNNTANSTNNSGSSLDIDIEEVAKNNSDALRAEEN